jgi:hypothetical protein
MIIRAVILGFVLWLAGTLTFRFAGDVFFHPDPNGQWMLLAAAPFVAVALIWVSTRLLRVRPGDEAEAAMGIALPGMLLGAYATHEFATVFPNLDPTLDGPFGALMLVAHGSMVFAGLLFTKLQPEDERL